MDKIPERPSERIFRENQYLLKEISSIPEYTELSKLCIDISSKAKANSEYEELTPIEQEAHDFLALFGIIGNNYVYKKFIDVMRSLKDFQGFEDDPLEINDKVKLLAEKIYKLAEDRSQQQTSR